MGRTQPGVAEGPKECWRPVEAGKDKEMGSPLEPPEHSPTSMSRMSCHSFAAFLLWNPDRPAGTELGVTEVLVPLGTFPVFPSLRCHWSL